MLQAAAGCCRSRTTVPVPVPVPGPAGGATSISISTSTGADGNLKLFTVQKSKSLLSKYPQWAEVAASLIVAATAIVLYSALALDSSFLLESMFADALFGCGLTTAHACCITAALPMAVDTIADYRSVTYRTKDSFWRIVGLCSFLLPSIVFIVFPKDGPSSVHLPVLYIADDYLQTTILLMSGFASVRSLCPGVLPSALMLLTISLHSIANCLRLYGVVYPTNRLLQTAGIIFYAFDMVALVTVAVIWIRFMNKRLVKGVMGAGTDKSVQFGGRLTIEEQTSSMYFLSLAFIVVIIIIANVASKSTEWQDSSEANLIVLAVSRIFITMPAYVLPARLAKNKALQLAVNLLDVKRSFVRYVSHEIRSPLNVSIAGLDMIRTEILRTNAPPSLLDLIADVYDSNETAVELLNDLLHYESIDAGTFNLDRQLLPLLYVFGDKLRPLVTAAMKKQIVVQVDDNAQVFKMGTYGDRLDVRSASLPMPSSIIHRQLVDMDRFRIDQVARNLITNAIKFSNSHSKIILRSKKIVNDNVPYVSDKSNNYYGCLRIEVEDFGAGIAPENQHRVFGEFSQISQNELQQGGGSGLGLWICKKIVELHDGRIGFTSEGRGMGCTFFFEIPIQLSKEEVPKSAEMSLYTMFPSTDRREGTRASFLRASFATRTGTGTSRLGSRMMAAIGLPEEDESAGTPADSSNGGSGNNESTPLVANKVKTIEPSEAVISFEDSMAFSAGLDSFELTEKGGSTALYRGGGGVGIGVDTLTTPGALMGLDQIPENGMKALRVLVVDDSAVNRKIIKRIIETDEVHFKGAMLSEADDGTTAVEAVKQSMVANRPFDVVLIDFIMTEMHGPDAVSIMRGRLGFLGCIIAVTGNASSEDYEIFLTNGANGVLTKPLNKQRFVDAFKDHGVIPDYDDEDT